MLFYIDYLDYTTSVKRASLLTKQLVNFRFDLLVFGSDTFCISVPACIKLKQTAEILVQLDDFWKNGKILLQLDEKHNRSPHNYFVSRLKKLENSMDEQRLLSHFEFQAYNDSRTPQFFGVYLPQKAKADSTKIFIKKERDTDQLFRDNTVDLINRHFDTLCSHLEPREAIVLGGVLNDISLLAGDQSALYQRALVEEKIKQKFEPSSDIEIISNTILDRAFALANAETSSAKPLSLILNQLTGKWMAALLRETYTDLYRLILNLGWEELYSLSQNTDWRSLVSCVNALIFLIQDLHIHKNKYDNLLERVMPQVQKSINVYLLLKFLAKEAVQNITKKAFEMGCVSEAQNFEMMITLQQDCMRGNLKYLYDVLSAIDLYVDRVVEDLTKIQRYKYLESLGDNQKSKPYEILR